MCVEFQSLNDDEYAASPSLSTLFSPRIENNMYANLAAVDIRPSLTTRISRTFMSKIPRANPLCDDGAQVSVLSPFEIRPLLKSNPLTLLHSNSSHSNLLNFPSNNSHSSDTNLGDEKLKTSGFSTSADPACEINFSQSEELYKRFISNSPSHVPWDKAKFKSTSKKSFDPFSEETINFQFDFSFDRDSLNFNVYLKDGQDNTSFNVAAPHVNGSSADIAVDQNYAEMEFSSFDSDTENEAFANVEESNRFQTDRRCSVLTRIKSFLTRLHTDSPINSTKRVMKPDTIALYEELEQSSARITPIHLQTESREKFKGKDVELENWQIHQPSMNSVQLTTPSVKIPVKQNICASKSNGRAITCMDLSLFQSDDEVKEVSGTIKFTDFADMFHYDSQIATNGAETQTRNNTTPKRKLSFKNGFRHFKRAVNSENKNKPYISSNENVTSILKSKVNFNFELENERSLKDEDVDINKFLIDFEQAEHEKYLKEATLTVLRVEQLKNYYNKY